MNILQIKDENKVVEEVEAATLDKLERIFLLQRVVMHRFREVEKKNDIYCPESPDPNSPKDQERIRSMFMRIIQELVEGAECLKNKPWKTTHVLTDVDHLKEELADALHFFVELCIELSITPQELYELYVKKNKVNHWRVDTKY